MPSADELIQSLLDAHKDQVDVGKMPETASAFLRTRHLLPKDQIYIGEEHAKIPSVLAHELGHLDFDKTRLGGVLQHPLVRGGTSRLATPLSSVAGLLAARSDSDAAPYAAAAVPLLMHAPTLVSEAGASLNALKKLRGLGADPAQLSQARRQLGGAFSSYLGHAGLSGLAAAAPLLAKRYWKKPQEEKTADENSIGVFQKEPSQRPRMQRALQGALAGAGISGLAMGGMYGLAPDVLGADRKKRVTRALLTMLQGAGAGAGTGSTVGTYEAARFQGTKPRVFSGETWFARRLGQEDRARDQKNE